MLSRINDNGVLHYAIAQLKYLHSACICFLLFQPASVMAQAELSTCKKVESMLVVATKMHIQPPVFDKVFAEQVIENYIYSLDPQCEYFYNRDILALKQLCAAETHAEAAFCKSFDYVLKVYPVRLKETDSIVSSFTKKKFQWLTNDSMRYYESFANVYAKNVNQKIKQVEDKIKLSVLNQLSLLGRLEKNYEFEKNDSTKQKVITKYKKGLQRNAETATALSNYLEENLLQAIIGNCDPHSNYFTAHEKNNFKAALSTSSEKFGFYFELNREEHIEIVAIQPGSPAWKCNKLNVGDEVIRIKFLNKPVIDLSDYELEEFNELITSSVENELSITVLKKSGATVEVNLIKAEIKTEENSVNGYIIEKKQAIGYISLPSFYTDFTENSPNGCANDVAKEITKMKEENIKGLILDLRNNGGGSVDEAANLAGIFIDAAPLYIEKIRDQKPRVIKDMNRGAIYDGPLVVIINKGSASASELLALMLKTQHRAIIVGETSYGKATGQIVMPLDTAVNFMNLAQEHPATNGYVKITLEKLYDLTGTTYQKTGVIPHIKIPDLWSSHTQGEARYTNALPNDAIDKKVIVNTLPDAKVNTCAALSAERIKNDLQFKRCLSLGDTIHAFYKNNAVPLHPLKYNALIESVQHVDSIVDVAFSITDSLLNIRPAQHNVELIKMDEFLRAIIDEEINSLKTDIIIRETYHILSDYTN